MDLGLVNPAVRVALDGLTMRQEAIANNVANINTANYTASSVDFESALQDAVAYPNVGPGMSSGSTISTSLQTGPYDQRGNNVDLEHETLLGTETNLRYQLAIRAMEGRFTQMSDVIKGA
jgi:flagellar basal-body rod protein FlgB